MAKKSKKPSPFDVLAGDANADARRRLGEDLAREVEDALIARARIIGQGGQIDLADWYYEQGQTPAGERPFVGAADLTSYFITENVDALKARLMKAVFGVRPFCFVEGWGADASKAPFVEEFHDWQVRRNGLKLALGKTILGALVEDCYVLEVSERVETRKIEEEIDVAFELNGDGSPVFEDGEPKLALDASGNPIPPREGQPHAKVRHTHTKTKRLGPQYDPISMRDFVFLPGHAKSWEACWGYAYRIWKRVPQLLELAKDGIYDADAVEGLGRQSDRQDATYSNTIPPSSDVAPQYDESVEKELFQLSFKRDLDEDGREEWYVATISIKTRQLLRLNFDKFAQRIGRPRCVPLVLFPRRDSVYGYSYAFDKLLTLAEEHTSIRNMRADRSALATNKPIMQLQNGLWDPDEEPFGVGAIIKVRDMAELREMQVSDVPASVTQSEQLLHQAKERVGGLSDSAVGVLSPDRRTLGENRLVAGGSAVRVDETIGWLHLFLAEVMYISHAIWVETLQNDPRGIEAPPRVAQALQGRGIADFKGKFTANQLQGDFQFEPYGSDSLADPQVRRQEFTGFFQSLVAIVKAFPSLAPVLQSQEAGKASLEQLLRVFDVRDRQPFLSAFANPTAPAQPAPAAMGPGGAPMGGAAPAGGTPDLKSILAAISGGAAPGAGAPAGGAPVGGQ